MFLLKYGQLDRNAPKVIFWVLFCLNTSLLVANLGLPSLNSDPSLVKLFDLNEEGNLASLFASTLWLLIALSACICYWLDRAAHLKSKKRWLLIAAAFFVVALDEVFAFHESILTPYLRDFFNDPFWNESIPAVAVQCGNWLLVYVPIALVFLLLVGKFLWRKLDSLWMKTSFILGIVCIASAFTHEYVQWLIGYYGGLQAVSEVIDPQRWMLASQQVEEMLENFGAILIIYSFSLYIDRSIAISRETTSP